MFGRVGAYRLRSGLSREFRLSSDAGQGALHTLQESDASVTSKQASARILGAPCACDR